jgi:hypothetical protein
MLLMFESKHEKGLGHTLTCPDPNKGKNSQVLSLSRSEKQLNNICIAHALPVLSPSRFGKETLTTFVSPVLSLSRSEKKLNNICIAHAEVEDSSCQYLCVSSH